MIQARRGGGGGLAEGDGEGAGGAAATARLGLLSPGIANGVGICWARLAVDTATSTIVGHTSGGFLLDDAAAARYSTVQYIKLRADPSSLAVSIVHCIIICLPHVVCVLHSFLLCGCLLGLCAGRSPRGVMHVLPMFFYVHTNVVRFPDVHALLYVHLRTCALAYFQTWC